MQKIQRLLNIMQTLLSENGCPWDREQTHTSLLPYMIEETYEFVEAAEEDNAQKMKEELGDLLLHIVFQSAIAERENRFSMEDVAHTVSEKMTRRHPHVFGDQKLATGKDVETNWEKIKKAEKKPKKESILEGLPKQLPALIKAKRVQERAAAVGFDWDHIDPIFEKVREEFYEFMDAWKEQDSAAMEEELGDLFFSIVNLARFIEKDPEKALNKTIQKFINRFNFIEKEVERQHKEMSDFSLQELDELWEAAKTKE